MVSLIPGSRFNYTGFDISPVYEPMNMCPLGQSAPIFDDGTDLTVTFRSAEELVADGLDALVDIKQCNLSFPASALAINDGGRTLTAKFTSPAQLKMGSACTPKDMTVTLSGCATDSKRPGQYKTIYVAQDPPAKKTPKPSLLQITSTQLVLLHGTASADLFIQRGDSKAVFLQISGGDIVDVAPAASLSRGIRGFEVASDVAASVLVRNLTPGKVVTFWLTGEKGEALTPMQSVATVSATQHISRGVRVSSK